MQGAKQGFSVLLNALALQHFRFGMKFADNQASYKTQQMIHRFVIKSALAAFLLVFSASGFFCGTLLAQKVVYVDLQYVLKNLPQYETANEQLSMISRRWQKEIETLEQEARLLETNYQTEQIFLSPDLKNKREEEILAKQNEALELKRRYFGKDGELFKKREALLKPIQDEIYTVIQEIANEKRYDVVKDRSADPALIYMSSKLDISDIVLQKLGAK